MGEATFADLKQKLLDTLGDLLAVADEHGSSRSAEVIADLEKKLEEERFNVVVAGEFKRGKTTFVNALLGSEVLPAAVVPLTSVVTVVAYADEVRAEIVFRDGGTEPVEVVDLARFVTERGNPENRLGVDRAILSYPAEDLRDGVFLIDTPGVGSIYRHNTDAARAFLPEADAAIFLVSADPPISEGERTFLEEVRDASARMFFVLNKVDYLSEHDAAEALSFTKEVVRASTGREAAVYPISARLALEAKASNDDASLVASGFPRFERAFRSFLLHAKGAAILASTAEHARKLAADERNSLDIEERALAMSEQQLAAAAGSMERIFEDAHRARDDIRTLLDRDVRRVLQGLEGRLLARRDHDAPALIAELERDLGVDGDVPGGAGGLDGTVTAAIDRVVGVWRTEEEHEVADHLRVATTGFVDQTNDLVERTVRACGELLELDLEVAAPLGAIAGESRFTLSPRETPGLLESMLPDLRTFLPRKLAGKRRSKEIRERIPDLLEKQAGRLRWDFQQRLDRSRIALQRELDGRLDATVEGLRLGVDRAARERAQRGELTQAERSRIAELRKRLRSVDSEIEAVVAAASEEIGDRPS